MIAFSPLHELGLDAPEHPGLERYVTELNLRLLGLVSDEERARLIEESLGHLEATAQLYEDRGAHPDIAVQAAIASYGDAKSVAEECILSWYEKQTVSSPILRKLGRGRGIAFGLFGCADLAYLIFLQIRVFLPSPSGFHVPYSPAQVRSIFPEPLPFPDMTPQFFVLVGYPLLVPILLGWLCGRIIPLRATQSVYLALMPIIVSSYLIGALLLPSTEPLLFAVVQTLFWLPVGVFSAYLSSWIARVRRERRIGRAECARPPSQNR